MGFIGSIPEGGPVPKKKKSRTAAGITVAIVLYSLAFSTIYASYSIRDRGGPKLGATPHPETTLLASPPMPVMKAAPVFKQASRLESTSQSPAPTRPPAPSKTDLMKTAGLPRPIDQIQSKTEPNTQISSAASAAHSRGVETASGVPASGGAVPGAGTGNGAVTGSGAGRGGASSAGVNYNEV